MVKITVVGKRSVKDFTFYRDGVKHRIFHNKSNTVLKEISEFELAFNDNITFRIAIPPVVVDTERNQLSPKIQAGNAKKR